MAKKILVLNGSPRLNGNTACLTEALLRGAREAGCEASQFVLQTMQIRGCLGCIAGGKDPAHPCVQHDDMEKIYPVYQAADVVVLASPMYYWTFSSQLYTALDRLFAVTELDPDYKTPRKECILVMAAESNTQENFLPIREYYARLTENLGWTSLGMLLAGGNAAVGDIKGKPILEEAYKLGKSLA